MQLSVTIEEDIDAKESEVANEIAAWLSDLYGVQVTVYVCVTARAGRPGGGTLHVEEEGTPSS